jgi:hypothetical protein
VQRRVGRGGRAGESVFLLRPSARHEPRGLFLGKRMAMTSS